MNSISSMHPYHYHIPSIYIYLVFRVYQDRSVVDDCLIKPDES